jgi:hypothetical protein
MPDSIPYNSLKMVLNFSLGPCKSVQVREQVFGIEHFTYWPTAEESPTGKRVSSLPPGSSENGFLRLFWRDGRTGSDYFQAGRPALQTLRHSQVIRVMAFNFTCRGRMARANLQECHSRYCQEKPQKWEIALVGLPYSPG